MSMVRVEKPHCVGCEHHHSYSQVIPKRAKGIMLHLGDHYCVGGKKCRKLKAREFKNGVPTDCPRLKTVPLLRVYCFKDRESMAFEKLFSRSSSPSAHAYAMRYQSESPLSAWMLCNELEQGENPVNTLLDLDEVLEIDDGFCPYYFHKTEAGLLVCLFDREVALKNKLTQNIQLKRSDEKND